MLLRGLRPESSYRWRPYTFSWRPWSGQVGLSLVAATPAILLRTPPEVHFAQDQWGAPSRSVWGRIPWEVGLPACTGGVGILDGRMESDNQMDFYPFRRRPHHAPNARTEHQHPGPSQISIWA